MRRILIALVLPFCLAATPGPDVPTVEVDPFVLELRAFLEASQERLDELQLRWAVAHAAADMREARDLAAEIAAAKRAEERGILQIRLRQARAEGNDEAVASVRARLEALDRPAPPELQQEELR